MATQIEEAIAKYRQLRSLGWGADESANHVIRDFRARVQRRPQIGELEEAEALRALAHRIVRDPPDPRQVLEMLHCAVGAILLVAEELAELKQGVSTHT